MLSLKKFTALAAAMCMAAPAGSAMAMPQTDLRSPDTRDAAAFAEVARTVDLRSPDARDAGRPAPQPRQAVRMVTPPAGEGFQWGDAGIGAAGMLALVLLGSSAGMAVAQRRRPGRATTASR